MYNFKKTHLQILYLENKPMLKLINIINHVKKMKKIIIL